MAEETNPKKVCARCRALKPYREFGDNLKMRLGKKSYCRLCEKKVKDAWKRRQADKDK